MIALIDGDMLLYRAAFSSQASSLSLEDSLDNTNKILYETLHYAGTANYIGFLQGQGNFRRTLSPIYKQNRRTIKPLYFNEIRKHLLTLWRFYLVNGIESDDAISLSSRLVKERYIICSNDKDLNQIPGTHLYLKKTAEYQEISCDEADYYFWQQMLTGDRVDSIYAIPGIGPVKSKRILQESTNFPQTVFEIYTQHYKTQARSYFSLNYRLLKLLTVNKDFVLPPVCEV